MVKLNMFPFRPATYCPTGSEVIYLGQRLIVEDVRHERQQRRITYGGNTFWVYAYLLIPATAETV